MYEFTLPALGADMDEATLNEWLVEPGDHVTRGQVVAVVETVKAAMEIECWHDGTVHQLLVQAGDTVQVGTALATLLEPDETPPPQGDVVPPVAATASRRITPAARHEAATAGIELSSIKPSTPDGVVTLEDVRRAAQAGTPARTVRPPGPSEGAVDARSATAAAMARSNREIPHYYLSEEIPLSAAQEWLTETNRTRPVSERILMAALQVRAVALALERFPELNGFWRGEHFEHAQHTRIGVAVSLRRGGLLAPAVDAPATKSLSEVMTSLTDLVTRARAGRLRASEVVDASITVTNLGDDGVDAVFGLIYPPQVALVGFGRVTQRPWVASGAIGIAPTVIATLAADHRASDGRTGAHFLAHLRRLLEDPDRM